MWRSAMANRALIAPAWLPAQEPQRRQLLRDRPRGTARVGPGRETFLPAAGHGLISIGKDRAPRTLRLRRPGSLSSPPAC